jgi:hypothetical protein
MGCLRCVWHSLTVYYILGGELYLVPTCSSSNVVGASSAKTERVPPELYVAETWIF